MDEQEQTVINLIVNSGSALVALQLKAIQYAKAGDLAKADESLQQAKETVNERDS